MAKNSKSAPVSNEIEQEMKESMERLSESQNIVVSVFGAGSARDQSFIFKVYDYLEMLEASGVDSDEFVDDLKNARKIAADLFKTDAPNADQTFGVFDRLYVGSDE
jgi:hypothetical protein